MIQLFIHNKVTSEATALTPNKKIRISKVTDKVEAQSYQLVELMTLKN